MSLRLLTSIMAGSKRKATLQVVDKDGGAVSGVPVHGSSSDHLQPAMCAVPDLRQQAYRLTCGLRGSQ